MKKPLYRVTDHALVRYLERVEGMDIETLRRQIGRIVQQGIEHEANGVISGGIDPAERQVSVVTIISRRAEIERGHKKRRGRKPRG